MAAVRACARRGGCGDKKIAHGFCTSKENRISRLATPVVAVEKQIFIIQGL